MRRVQIGKKLANMLALSIVLLFLIMLLLFYNRPHYVFMSIALISSCLVFFILSMKTPLYLSSKSKRVDRLFMSLFFFTISAVILIVQWRNSDYLRPTIAIILMAGAAACIATQIRFSTNSYSRILILAECFVLGLLVIYSQSLIFPSVVGVDSWWHYEYTMSIFDVGNVVENQQYGGTPLYHLLSLSSMLLLDVSFKSGLHLIVIPSFLLVSSFSIYCIAKRIFSTDIALLSVLLFYINTYTILFAIATIPNTIGFSLIVMALLIIMNLGNSKAKSLTLIITFLAVTLYHSLSAIALLIALFSVLAYLKLSRSTNLISVAENEFPRIGRTTLCLYAVLLLSWWLYMTTFLPHLSFLFEMGFSNPSLIPNGIIYDYTNAIPAVERIFNESARTQILELAVLGSLLLLIDDRVNVKASGLRICVVGSVFLILAFSTTVIGMDIIQSRWWFMGVELMVPIVAYGIIAALDRVKLSSYGKAVIVVALIFSLAISAFFSPSSCIDNPVISDNTENVVQYTLSELQGGGFISTHLSGESVITDELYGASVLVLYNRISDSSVQELPEAFLSGELVDTSSMWAIRELVAHDTFICERTPFKLSFNVNTQFMSNNANTLYVSDGIVIYHT